ncbi:hypothetical protein FACS1894193_07820 [Bacilli bacterium]|nr:hypothetical protein FACS1894193_07820 [Bacilli bacterium]
MYAFKITLVAIIGILVYLIVYAIFSLIKSQMPEERKQREELKRSEREMATAMQETHEFIRKWNEEIAEEKRKTLVATVFEGILYLDSEIEDADRRIRQLIRNDRLEFDATTDETKYDIVLKDGTLLGTLPKSVVPSLIDG